MTLRPYDLTTLRPHDLMTVTPQQSSIRNEQCAVALLGSLLLQPGLFVEVSHLVVPEMFPADLGVAARFIWDRESKGQGYDIASVCDAAGWDRAVKNEVIRSANPRIIAEHAAQVRDAHLARLDTAILEQAAAELRGGLDYWESTAKMDYQRAKVREGLDGYRNRKTELISAAMDRIYKGMKGDGLSGLSTGWTDLDRFLGGWQPGNLCVIGARPAMGKTTVMMHHARAAADAGHSAGILTLEMTGMELVTKWIAEAARISTGTLRSGALMPAQLDEIQNQAVLLHDLPVAFEDFAGLPVTGTSVRDRIRLLCRKEGCQIIFIDYLQLIAGDDRRQTRNYQLEEISRTLKATAKQLDITIVALSQLSRQVEFRGGSKRPNLADLRDSGSIEQDVDIGILLYRPEYYGILEDEDGASLTGILEYIVAKDRTGGIPRTFRRYWQDAQYLEAADPEWSGS